jgi:hypothetical protein
MIKTLLLFSLPLLLSASQILSYNTYERSDRADVMITFDTPFTGIIKQGKSTNKIIIKLQGVSIESSKVKKINSKFLHSLTITPLKNRTQIVATVSPSTKLVASKTSDSYGLRLRFTQKKATRSSVLERTKEPNLSALPTKKSTEFSQSYYIVIGILIVGIIILLYLKKRMQIPKEPKAKDAWLFNQTQAPQTRSTETQLPTMPSTSEVSIRFQKSINSANSVVMLDFGVESYLVLMGNNNILLDKFRDNKPTTQKEFESILQERNQELEEFLGSPNTNPAYGATKEPLQAYKERAASLIYGEES